MSSLSITELPRAERQEMAIRELLHIRGQRLGADSYDRQVGAQCAINAWRAGASPASAIARGRRYLVSLHGDRDGAA